MHWYTDALTKKYFLFTGRAGRTEFWMYVLFNFIVAMILAIVGTVLGGSGNYSSPAFLPYDLYLLATLLPSLGMAVRRLHDTGRSGWWILVGLVPIIGAVVLLIFYIIDSTPGDNQFGPHPSAARAVA
jgi:uncharacterized membrane protein YhaH (DUF805 family)